MSTKCHTEGLWGGHGGLTNESLPHDYKTFRTFSKYPCLEISTNGDPYKRYIKNSTSILLKTQIQILKSAPRNKLRTETLYILSNLCVQALVERNVFELKVAEKNSLSRFVNNDR